MPLVTIDLYPGRSLAQKREAAEAIVRVVVEKLGSQPKDVTIIFNDRPAHDWYAGCDSTLAVQNGETAKAP
ncbi:tautomerase family protein [Neoaquamicrobium sediminum]|uniref:tautomerase family protein n=1 Tax=Neoaquamicrobium sediminum TaxID=1849104 RepID=UPI0015669D0D|nr:tautomerase family protein [Mesorhizobium sediminum]NRC57266.1 4-oxalocrotonate tautomerase [Mesorhizobium sediminum]